MYINIYIIHVQNHTYSRVCVHYSKYYLFEKFFLGEFYSI